MPDLGCLFPFRKRFQYMIPLTELTISRRCQNNSMDLGKCSIPKIVFLEQPMKALVDTHPSLIPSSKERDLRFLATALDVFLTSECFGGTLQQRKKQQHFMGKTHSFHNFTHSGKIDNFQVWNRSPHVTSFVMRRL